MDILSLNSSSSDNLRKVKDAFGGIKDMSSKPYWESQYSTGSTPWDNERPDITLTSCIDSFNIKSCRTLEIGCGTGTNAIWLAEHGFDVLGVDISETAIEKAIKNSDIAGVNCRFAVLDFLNETVPESKFDFVFDRGCFHTFDVSEDRQRFAETVHRYIADNGVWLSLVGRSEGFRISFSSGPPRRSKSDILEAIEPYFEIISLDTNYFEDRHNRHPKNWVCFMRRK
jgi:SAM-dependent methyltransferase